MWVMTRDTRWLRLTNLLMNQMQPRINSTATLNATGGTRKSFEIPFYSTAPEILYADNTRSGFGVAAAIQQWRLIWEFTNTKLYNNPDYYEGLSDWVSMFLLNRQWPNGLTASTPLQTQVKVARERETAAPELTVTPSRVSAEGVRQGSVRLEVRRVAAGSSIQITVTETTGSDAHTKSLEPIQLGTLHHTAVGKPIFLKLRPVNPARTVTLFTHISIRIRVHTSGHRDRLLVRRIPIHA
jgi:hypothetical protein